MNGENTPKHDPTHQTDCDQLRDLLPAYSMNMTDPEESQLVAQLLADCPEVADEWADYQHMAEAMLFSAPSMPAPAHLADKLFEATSPPVMESEPPATLPSATPAPTIWERLGKMIFRDDSKRPSYLMPAFTMILTILVLLVGYLVAEVSTLNNRQDELNTEVASRDEFLALVSDNEIFRFDVRGVNDFSGTDTNGILLCNPDHTQARLQVENFDTLPNDTVYQIWLTDGSERVNVGTFEVDDEGMASVIFDAPSPMGEFQYISITPETDAGSEYANTDTIIRGRLY